MRYLARAIDPRSELVPVGRVASPLAELDQRLHDDAELVADLEEAEVPSEVHAEPTAPTPTFVVRDATAIPATSHASMSQRPVDRVEASRPRPPKDAFEALAQSLEVVERWVGAPTETTPTSSTSSSGVEPPKTPATDRVSHETRVIERVEASPLEDAPPVIVTRDARPIEASVIAPTRSMERTEERTALQVETKPSRVVAAPLPPSPRSQAVPSREPIEPRVERAPAPGRVTIGHLHVEVIRDAPTPKESPKESTRRAPRAAHVWPRARPFGWRQR